MAISKEQQKELTKLARAANRRLERASAGQRKSLEHNIQEYHTKVTTRGLVFEQGKAKTELEYRQRMAELRKFMAAKTSTRKGWEQLRKENLAKAQTTIVEMGYDVTDEELEIIIRETGGSSKAFYKALEFVTAEKSEREDWTELSAEEIVDAIRERKTDYEMTLELIKARENVRS